MSASVIFDMDGVLVDSEPLWWQAGTEALRSVGIALEDDWSIETRGMRTDEALEYWYRKFPWSGKSIGDLADDVNQRAIQIFSARLQPLPGVLELIELLSDREIPMAVCSSASSDVITAILGSLGIERSMRCIVSAHNEIMGKPHPAAYLRCAKLLKTDPHLCIAIEDSVSGAIAAKAAQMKVVVVQKQIDPTSGIFDFCDVRLRSLKEFDHALLLKLDQHSVKAGSIAATACEY